MYAMIRLGKGQYYTSMVFGYYRSSLPHDYAHQFWVVLNQEKTELILQPVFLRNEKYFSPLVLITDADESNWIKKGRLANTTLLR